MIIQILQETDLESRIWVQADYLGSVGNTEREVEGDKEKEGS